MHKSLIVYFSQGGTTARVAESIATGLGSAEYRVNLCNMKDEEPPDVDGYELFGVGFPVYYWRPPFNVMDYVESLPDLDGLAAFVFLLHGTYRGDAANYVRHALDRMGAREVGYFHCHGTDTGLPYRRVGYLFSADHPTAKELAEAEAFGREVAAHVAGKPYARPGDEPFVPDMVYRLERVLLSRRLIRQIYSRLFRVDPKACNACGVCMKLCPTGNIAGDMDGRPVWGRDCLLCLTCEVKCPRGAITSSVDWPIFRPLVMYNVRKCARDPSLDHERLTYTHGRLRRV